MPSGFSSTCTRMSDVFLAADLRSTYNVLFEDFVIQSTRPFDCSRHCGGSLSSIPVGFALFKSVAV